MFQTASVLCFLVFASQVTLASPLLDRLEESHRSYLDSRRALLPRLTDPFALASRARVIDELPARWDIEPTPWRRGIKATIFWVGEKPTPRNPTPNVASSWDPKWMESYGGYDHPEQRRGYLPKGFFPKQTPFYIALPYNDLDSSLRHQPEAAEVIPWFWKAYKGPGQSVCHGRWVAIHREGRICYAQWRDCGPFTTDDWNYVFKGARPQPNPNGNAGIDLSPAIRDYLKLSGNYLVDWKFVEDYEVPDGPWKNWLPSPK
ncbi:MAG: hypothetical protein Q7Q71_07690 [Verrucomicrobiota bacterium JB023]|nr:hypothetical protein [Verrucomicrobiota bacterium JB023]